MRRIARTRFIGTTSQWVVTHRLRRRPGPRRRLDRVKRRSSKVYHMKLSTGISKAFCVFPPPPRRRRHGRISVFVQNVFTAVYYCDKSCARTHRVIVVRENPPSTETPSKTPNSPASHTRARPCVSLDLRYAENSKISFWRRWSRNCAFPRPTDLFKTHTYT